MVMPLPESATTKTETQLRAFADMISSLASFFRQPVPAWFRLLVLAFALVTTAHVQAQPTREMRASIEAGRLELNQIEAALQRDNLDDKRLGDLKTRIEPLAQSINDILQREGPRADEIKARIDSLGPAPNAAKGESESPEVAKDRAEQQQLWREADETIRLARALDLRLGQVKDAISERRRQNFAKQILQQSASILSPLLWLDVSKALPGDFNAFRFLMAHWLEVIYANIDWYEAIILALLAFVAIAGLPRARLWVARGTLFGLAVDAGEGGEPTRLGKALHALRLILLNAIAPAAFFFLLHWLVQSFGLLPGRADPVLESITNGLAFIFAISGLANGILAPGRSDQRLFPLPDRMASQLCRMIQLVALIFSVGRVFDAMQSAIVASLPLTAATKGSFAMLVALTLGRGLKSAFGSGSDAASVPANLFPLRLGAWLGVVAVAGAAVFGYISLAGFLVTQIIWLTILGLVAMLIFVFIDEFLGVGLSSGGMFGRRVREATGLQAKSLDQVSALGAGFARLILIVALAMLALAPWGLDSANLIGNLKGAFFGFQVGGVTISLSNIALAIAFFAIGSIATRGIQNWLETNYLPHTDLDPGLRNSIRTILGYIGLAISIMVALSQLGLGLDKITLVAGALSVGIGFGLKSIVENFVSGLILLWERPIRVGDWIVVGEEQGTVKRINVRATEIQTFDRASLIIPNSEFISGRVKNWMHADRTGRIIIPVNVDYQADPQIVEKLLKDAALAHREVMSEPGPIVIFKNLGESGLDFELRCFVDVDAMAKTRSDLLYDIFARLREAKIDIPYPTRRLEITNLPANGLQPGEARFAMQEGGSIENGPMEKPEKGASR